MSCRFGENIVSELIRGILIKEAASFAVADAYFPLWRSSGFYDSAGNIHSHGISYLTAVGLVNNYMAVCEVPAPNMGPYAFAGDNVRSDVAWFCRTSGAPVMLCEFERYGCADDEQTLTRKMQNLLLAYHRWNQTAETLLLAYWCAGVADLPNHAALRNLARNGCQTAAGEQIKGAPVNVLFLQFLLRGDNGRLRLSSIRERGEAH
jgi:hypothetical protein